MSQNLYDAHRQWAVRPPDERFPSLEALYGFLNGRRRASEEEMRPLSQIEVKTATRRQSDRKWSRTGRTPVTLGLWPVLLQHRSPGQIRQDVALGTRQRLCVVWPEEIRPGLQATAEKR